MEMAAARKLHWITPEEYLASEIDSPIKHEYWNGRVYAMTRGTNNHALIATNVIGTLRDALRGGKCRVYSPDARIRIRKNFRDTRFYHPDASVICCSNAGNEQFQDEPVVIVEVLSPSTRRLDDGEKRDGYFAIPSLQSYLLVEQSKPEIIHFRRSGEDFEPELLSGLDAELAISCLNIKLRFADIYEGVSFEPESVSDEE